MSKLLLEPDCTRYNVALNPSPGIEVLSLGNECQPVVVLDDFLLQPEPLLQYAEQGEAFRASTTDFYPGVRKPLHGLYSKVISDSFCEVFRELFSLKVSLAPTVNLCALSLTTTKAKNLRPIQSLPHFDHSDSFQFAVVHYLCESDYGGTSFYRHRKTAYESITEDRVQSYARALKEEVVRARFPGKKYMQGDNEWFECIGTVKAKYYRAVFYRGNLLHSGDICSEQQLSSDPREGRLTANTFIHFS